MGKDSDSDNVLSLKLDEICSLGERKKKKKQASRVISRGEYNTPTNTRNSCSPPS